MFVTHSEKKLNKNFKKAEGNQLLEKHKIENSLKKLQTEGGEMISQSSLCPAGVQETHLTADRAQLLYLATG